MVKETFEATVDANKIISNIEKFTYLKSYLDGNAQQTIEGIYLTSDYNKAWKLLEEIYGSPKLVMSSQINNLIKLVKVTGSNVRELRCFFDKIESNVRALSGLAPIISVRNLNQSCWKKVPKVIRYQISQLLGTEKRL